MTRFMLAVCLAFALTVVSSATMGHHGWAWTTGGNIELVGLIKTARLGNPHGILEVDVEGEVWIVEVGQPWRNQRAGLNEGDLEQGVEIKAIGEPAADMSLKRLKVERLYLGDREYVLYPSRD